MHRVTERPRADWESQVEALGLTYHTIDGQRYWDESAHYRFTRMEISRLENATRELQRMCIAAAERAIRDDWRERLAIPEPAWREVIASWERDDLSLYGRFDLMWDGGGDPKLLEYNADTPTGLLEASVVQWQWLQQTHPHDDQFNSIHEQLRASWPAWSAEQIHFCAQRDSEEDWRTLLYLIDRHEPCPSCPTKPKSPAAAPSRSFRTRTPVKRRSPKSSCSTAAPSRSPAP
jgi:glutathionylspermidine synthase